MTKQTARNFALWLACISPLLFTAASEAQNKSGRGLGVHPQSSPAAAAATRPPNAPGSPSYTFVVLDYPGTFQTVGSALNLGAAESQVEVVGGYGELVEISQGGFRTHLSKSKGMVNEGYDAVNFPGSSQQSPFGVNDAGQIVGEYVDSAGVFHGYELSGVTYTAINVPFSGATQTEAGGINNSGEIVGGWNGSGSSQHAFTLIGGTYTSFDYPSAIQTFADGLNNNGDIVGWYVDTAGVQHGFLLSGGTFTTIDPPGSTDTIAQGINDKGDIVGVYCPTIACQQTDVGYQAFLLSGGTYTTLNVPVPGITASQAFGINNRGMIVAIYIDGANLAHTFVAVP
jgi:hypothetical protein